MFEVMLLLRPFHMGESLPIARTDDAAAVAAAQSAILCRAVREVALWEIEPATKAVAMAELHRLKTIFEINRQSRDEDEEGGKPSLYLTKSQEKRTKK